MADDVLAVEAVPLEEDFDTLVASLAIDDTLEDKLAKLKENVDEKLADYADVKRIENDEDFKAAKKYRTAVNNMKKPIEAQRKAAKKKYSDLLKTFDKTIGEITAPIDALSDEYKAVMKKMASLPNLYLKVSGFPTADNKFVSDLLKFTRETFDSDKLLYASNWPVVKLYSTFDEHFSVLRDEFGDDEDFFMNNAVRAYGLKL